jgi:hypothetical protein
MTMARELVEKTVLDVTPSWVGDGDERRDGRLRGASTSASSSLTPSA